MSLEKGKQDHLLLQSFYSKSQFYDKISLKNSLKLIDGHFNVYLTSTVF